MNILFASYGGFDCNSSPFIAAYANALSRLGNHTAIAVAQRKADDLRDYDPPLFKAVDYKSAFEPGLFADGRPADILHAWTPRELVRKFAVRYAAGSGCRVVVHLEDNEEHVSSVVAGKPFTRLVEEEEHALQGMLPANVSHPRRYKLFLDYADAATIVWPTLEDFLPRGYPFLHLPVCPPAAPPDRVPSDAMARRLNFDGSEKILVYTGGVNGVNLPDQRSLYEAVVMLNRRGVKCRLLRTGPKVGGSADTIFPGSSPFVTELGFLPRRELRAVMELADVFVQPGADDEFNHYRLPCKIPEFLEVGIPIIVPRANVGTKLRDREDALILRDGCAEEIARQCTALFADQSLAANLSSNAKRLAREHFHLGDRAGRLAAFYREVLDLPCYRSARGVFSEESFLGGALEQSKARADSGAVARVAGQLIREHPPRHLYAALYYAFAENAFSEDKSLTQYFSPGAAQTVEFTGLGGESGNSAVWLRFDPLDAPGEFRLHGIRVVNRANGAELFSWRPDELRPLGEVVALDAKAGIFLSLGRDPSFVVPAFEPPAGVSWVVQADLEVDASPRLVPSTAVVGSAAALAAATLRTQEQRTLLEKARADLRIAERSARAGQSQVDDLNEEVRRRDRAIAEIRASTCWRITAPYRFFGDVVIRCWQLARLAFSANRAFGSLGQTCGVAMRAMRRHGVRGTLDRALLLMHADPERFSRLDYNAWVECYDTIDDSLRAKMKEEMSAWESSPLISVVMPVYNPSPDFLRAAIDSVRSQAYPHWELCIADDCSPDGRVREILRDYAATDPRIKVEFLDANAGISEASNVAARLATGRWLALLDHDDVLRDHALFMVAKAVRENPGARLFYSDEDKINSNGVRYNPYHKPDWNPSLFHSHNLITHLGVYDAEIFRELGGFRRGFEGAQDYDLALRFTEKIKPEEIFHIPHILYHWRAHAASTAEAGSNAKPYAMLNGEKALNEHLQRRSLPADAALIGHGFRVRYQVTQPPRVSLIIPTKDRVELVSRCVESIQALTDYPDYEVVIVDNGSEKTTTLDYFRRLSASPSVRVLRVEGEFNFSLLNNRAVDASTGDVVGLLNNDLEATHGDWLGEMSSHAIRPEIGAVGALLLYPDDTIQHAGVVLGIGGVAGHSHKSYPVTHHGYFGRLSLISDFSAVTGACLVVRKSLYKEAGGLDEENLKVAFNDVDFCLRLRELGYRNLFTPFARFYHHESASRGYENTKEKIRRFKMETLYMTDRWGDALTMDPAYNPNLSLEAEDFSFAWPPRIGRLSVRPERVATNGSNGSS